MTLILSHNSIELNFRKAVLKRVYTCINVYSRARNLLLRRLFLNPGLDYQKEFVTQGESIECRTPGDLVK